MKKLVIICLVLVGLASCKFLCDAVKIGATGMANFLSGPNQLDCDNPDEMVKDFTEALNNTVLCKKADSAQGTIADIMCPIVDAAVIKFLVPTIPAKYGCHKTVPQTDLNMWLLTACKLLPW